MKKVIKKFPGTKWADLAAYRLLDNKTCGEWAAEAKCPEMEATLYMKYVDEHPQSPKTPEALYKAAWRYSALIVIYKSQQRRQEGRRLDGARHQRGKENHDAVSRHHRLGHAGGASAVHGAERNTHLWQCIAVTFRNRLEAHCTTICSLDCWESSKG